MTFPSPGDLPDPGIEPGSPALQANSLPNVREAFTTQGIILLLLLKGLMIINDPTLLLFSGIVRLL